MLLSENENPMLPFDASKTKIVGFEICESAVEDAIRNAARNNLPLEYVVGKAEDTIPGFLSSTDSSIGSSGSILAVVDPPRSGLHPKVLKALRKNSKISKLIYVSCNIVSMMQDLVYLLFIFLFIFCRLSLLTDQLRIA